MTILPQHSFPHLGDGRRRAEEGRRDCGGQLSVRQVLHQGQVGRRPRGQPPARPLQARRRLRRPPQL